LFFGPENRRFSRAFSHEKSRTTGQKQENTYRNIPKVHTLPKIRIKKAHPTKKPPIIRKKTR